MTNCEDCGDKICHSGDDDGNLEDSLICIGCNQRRYQRKEAVVEIIDTEQNYGNDLNIINEVRMISENSVHYDLSMFCSEFLIILLTRLNIYTGCEISTYLVPEVERNIGNSHTKLARSSYISWGIIHLLLIF